MRSLAQPTCDAQLVAGTALELLRRYEPARPVRLLGVRVAGLAHDAAQAGDRGAAERDAAHAGDGAAAQPDAAHVAGGEDQLRLPVGAQ